MKLSEKLFVWFSAMVSVMLLVTVVLTALQKQGYLDDWDPSQWIAAFMEQHTGGGEEPGNGTEDTTEETTGESHGETITETEPEPEAPTAAETEPEPADASTETTVPSVIIEAEAVETEEEPYPYYIKVNKKQNCITIYTKDSEGEYTKPVKAMICSTGNATPLGTFDSKAKYLMKGLINGVFGQYSTWITGNILFHSVPSARATKDSVSVRNYNQLGTTASAGCIRLTVADAKWIYDNCEVGTTIEIYEGEDPGPLGKPEAIRLPDGSKWDPTDPDPENPWREHGASIQVPESNILYFGQPWDPLCEVTALDTCGNDITEKIEAEGEVDLYVPGNYPVTYSVTDAIGKSASVSVEYLVIPVPYWEKDRTEEEH